MGQPLVDPLFGFLHTPFTDHNGDRIDPLDVVQGIQGMEDIPQLGLAAVGGFVYRGDKLRDLDGDYIFASATSDPREPSGRLIKARKEGSQWKVEPLIIDKAPGMQGGQDDGGQGANTSEAQRGVLPFYILGIGEDHEGELYVLTNQTLGPRENTGRVFKLEMTEGEQPEGQDNDQRP
jgi:hypothetical protein